MLNANSLLESIQVSILLVDSDSDTDTDSIDTGIDTLGIVDQPGDSDSRLRNQFELLL